MLLFQGTSRPIRSTASLPIQRPVADNYSLGSESIKLALGQCFFAMEHTGWYTLELCCFLQDQQLGFALYSPLHLKRSLGLARGKNDRVDAQRIAHYAFLHRHELTPTLLPSASLLKLKNLFAFRERL